MRNSLWNQKFPIIGLAPMDGISDFAFREITKKHGHPDLMFTEFEHVGAISNSFNKIYKTLKYSNKQRPIIAQLYGNNPAEFYHASKVIRFLGFDGVDINMGCPSKNVTSSGAGASLIKTPEIAKKIFLKVKEGVSDFENNKKISGLNKQSIKFLKDNFSDLSNKVKKFTFSIKTRLGYDLPLTKTWISLLSKLNPDFLSVHGRTLKQMYTGKADWNELKLAVEIAKNTPVFVNGDVKSKEDIEAILNLTNADGVLIGRASLGNPWVFRDYNPNFRERIKVLIEHSEIFEQNQTHEKEFVRMRKHFGWYIKGFENASVLRKKLFESNNVIEVKEIIKKPILSDTPFHT